MWFIPSTNKIMITGGYSDDYLDSTEILDTEDGSVTMASPMNSIRASHGIGVVTINGEDRLAVVGGYDGNKRLDSIETYNSSREKWETTNIRLKVPNRHFGFQSVKLFDIISRL